MTFPVDAIAQLKACGLSASDIGTAAALLSSGDEYLPPLLSSLQAEELRISVEAYLCIQKSKIRSAGTCAERHGLGKATRRRAMRVSQCLQSACDIADPIQF
jgi:hypothetical protein